ncbi:MAG: tRNA (adenosine(37)-N6)-threonylcarbamoyltransferase complex ATPase subunit type 1 TsaE [Alistipes sp.]|nr:tRNA (adenosine(37)-N6)-threonylcarbamoyltransferase complex ATPase subunit type 1 TsaE [Alistipes sp.]MBQ2842681.1 tRNA (adenosine(37)-N6)-threonylcarbamoyltransferase complex ATPase subunit type 1 TsaE [Alistipes sp.]MBR3773146.1 tRNA (adenosine(37)-N6)-threonylcarbamoyltransferase complex ATPase subunit type 1 TsaE [Alistipes sp.]MBR4052694.1 tRNA (adenosine(37)-N6)-threonylcarbamoyltransferase complex ATPase subunit type 1 TsaE [Alistipes sp.]
MKRLSIDSEDQLHEVAEALLDSLDGRTVVALRGEMGAGKTTLVRAVAEQLGASDQVTSPTFALVNQYEGAEGERIFHFDFYRIEDEREAFDLGYEEYFYSGDLCFVEWPEKIEGLMPDAVMEVRITVEGPTERSFEIE